MDDIGIFRTTIAIEHPSARGVRRELHDVMVDPVFAEEGDLVLLGVRALEGLNLRVDVVTRQLVSAGPVPAAALCATRAAA